MQPGGWAIERLAKLLGEGENLLRYGIPTIWVHAIGRIARNEAIQVRAVTQLARITACPSPQPRRVVSSPVVVEPGSLIALLARVAVAFEAHLGGGAAGL